MREIWISDDVARGRILEMSFEPDRVRPQVDGMG